MQPPKGNYGPYASFVSPEFQGVKTSGTPRPWPVLKKPMPEEGSVYDWVYQPREGKWKQVGVSA